MSDLKKVVITRANGEKVDAEVVPFSVSEEPFSYYQPNVPEGHPLFGRTIKVKSAVIKMLYVGQDKTDEPIVQIQAQQLVAVE